VYSRRTEDTTYLQLHKGLNLRIWTASSSYEVVHI